MDNGINYIQVGGDELAEIGYDEVTKTLYVRLNNEQTRIYYDVPEIANISLLSAENIEAHYNERIKDRYRHRGTH
ncbi:KTSC domain-containing protein [Anaerobacillus sp. MEB173]|uniref:KTSC domain-containing protein n=1 Tax=Anaerobacillus sp. MEB173 TaxID=3383345 RepID=UPI003F906BB4